MVSVKDLLNKTQALSLVGLGYVGLPIAVAFAKKVNVIGFDISKDKIELYKKGEDPTCEVGGQSVRDSGINFTSDASKLRDACFHIVAVPTPINTDKTPDLSPIKKASRLLGGNLTKGSVVVYESTVYPGVTEEVCIPILEQASGLKCGVDFKVGYSPERINPGDKLHRLDTIVKIVSGMDDKTLDLVASVYELVVDAGIYRASSIKVAEAAKVIENSQRDINIAFMNELSIIFQRLGIDTLEVLQAAGTKWNFLNFRPGLVGGHCIGIDPYYLTYRAEQAGYNSQIILAGRRINDSMGKYVAENTVKQFIKTGCDFKNLKVGILGLTFKENCPDTRNTKVIDIIDELKEYGIIPLISDPIADVEEAWLHYGIAVLSLDSLKQMDCLIIAVGHQMFLQLEIAEYLKPGGLVVDVKGILNQNQVLSQGYRYWRL